MLDLCWNLFIRHLEMSVAKYHLVIQYTRNLDFMLFFPLLWSSNSFAWTRTCNELARDHVSACERHSSNDGLMLGQRLRRWPNIKPSLVSCVVPGHAQRYYSAVVSFFHNNNRKWQCNYTAIPTDTRHWINVGLTLNHRLRRWASVKLTLIQLLVSFGMWRKWSWQ